MLPNENVELKKSSVPSANNGVFARKAFSPGDLVAVVERPLVTELEIDRMLDTCAWCCHRGATDPTEKAMAASMGLPHGSVEIKSCTGCQRVGYCSKSCQSKAWKREHKHECKVINVKDRPALPPGVRGGIKILGRLKADPKSEIANVHDILNLWPAGDTNGLNKIGMEDPKKFEDFKVLGNAAWHYSEKPKVDGLDPQAISTGILSNIMSNSFDLTSPLDNTKLGIGFDPLMCSVNHSCEPNAAAAFNQPQYEIRALKDIAAGEEIFIKYVEVTNPFGVRQAELKKSYSFTCGCTKCTKGVGFAADQYLERPADLDSKYKKMADRLAKRHEPNLSPYLLPGSDTDAQRRVAAIHAEASAVFENAMSTIDEIKEAIQMCIGSKMWHWTRQPVPQLLRRLFALYLESGAIYQSFRIGIKLHFEIHPVLYPQEFYPDRLIVAWVVSTLINVLCGAAHQELYQELAQGGIDLRVVYFEILYYLHDHTPKMYGPKTPFGKAIDNTYNQIMAGVNIPEATIREKTQALRPFLEALAHNVTDLSL